MGTRALPEIDYEAIDEFTCGQCHALALAIHERTDLPLAGIWRFRDTRDDTPKHVVVMLPDESLLDIEGPHAEERWDGHIAPLDIQEVLDFQNRDYRAPDMGNARRYAQAVLKQYGIKSNGDNSRDKVLKGRQRSGPKGEDHYQAKLTVKQVRSIRKLNAQGQTQRSLARQFGVGQSSIFNILHRKVWRHVL